MEDVREHDLVDADLLDEDGQLHPMWPFLTFHQALRRDARRFRLAAAELANGGHEVDLGAMAEHWDRYHQRLDLHHETEDAHLLPMVREARADLAPLVDELAQDHLTLEALLARTDAAVSRALEGHEVEALVEVFTELEDLLGPHLAAEEEHLVPAMRQIVAEQAAAPPVGEGRQGSNGPSGPGSGPGSGPPGGPVDEAFDGPWTLEHLSDEVLRAVMATLPADQVEQYPQWLEAYQQDLARWAR